MEVCSFTSDADYAANGPAVGKEASFFLEVDRHELQAQLGVEVIVTKQDPEKNQTVIIEKKEFDLVKEEGSKLFFELHMTETEAGPQQIGFRIFPKNHDLPHRMDFAYIRWIQL